MKNKFPLLIYAVLTLIAIAGAFMCAFWLPDAAEYLSRFIQQTAFYWICGIIAAPFFAILLAAFAFPNAVKHDTVFSARTARLLHVISIALLIDCALLCTAAVWLLLAGEVLLSPALLFVALIGMTIAVMLFILAQYVNRAAILKAEADATL